MRTCIPHYEPILLRLFDRTQSSCCFYLAGIGLAQQFASRMPDELSYNCQNVKKCKYSNWGVWEFSTELKSAQQETLTVASTIGNFRLYDNFKI